MTRILGEAVGKKVEEAVEEAVGKAVEKAVEKAVREQAPSPMAQLGITEVGNEVGSLFSFALNKMFN
jgi:hypothetical protein